MNYHIKDIALLNEEFKELSQILGEHLRICRDQNNTFIGKQRQELTENLIYKLLTETRNRNIYSK